MTTSQMNEVVQRMRRAALLRDGVTDGQLLEDYVSRRDEAALAALVLRHGPMVWGVCCRVLRNGQDSEDAFQATFLVLVRKAASIVPRELLANWLYGVAHQTALKARATAAKRRARERQVMDLPEPEVAQQELWHDLQPLLDQELSRLPAKYRMLIVLCDLEGKTRKEAARQIGCPEGTVAGRLSRARAMLAKRLARRGLAVSAGPLAVALAHNAASAAVPTSVLSHTIKVAGLFAAGESVAAGSIPARIAALRAGVLKAMWITKLKALTAALLLLGTVAVIAGMLAIGRIRATAIDAEQPVAKAQDTVKEPQSGKKNVPAQAKKQEGGKEVKGLVALAEVGEKSGMGLIEVRLSLKNVSDKPITLCDCPYLEQIQVQWIGPDGKTRKSQHNNFPPSNFLESKDYFVQIAPGAVRRIFPTIRFHTSRDKPGKVDVSVEKKPGIGEGVDSLAIEDRSNLAEAGEQRVTVRFTNDAVSYAVGRGDQGGPSAERIVVDNVWTGTAIANEVAFTVK